MANKHFSTHFGSAFLGVLGGLTIAHWVRCRRLLAEDGSPAGATGLLGAIGNTPLIRVNSLSAQTGCHILGKAEFMNPSGSLKDRAAKAMVLEAERQGILRPHSGQALVEATGGNTGISLALIGQARGYRTLLTLPNNVSGSKIDKMKLLGAEVAVLERVPFSDPNHFYHVAQRLAQEQGGFWTNQFENEANWQAHYATTGPEIFTQTSGKLDAFVCSSGTGGTMAGTSSYLKFRDPHIQTVLADCSGSGLAGWINCNRLDPSPESTVTEGIGNSRITGQMTHFQVDRALKVSDREAIEMMYYLLRNDGLWVGPSAALNAAAAVKVARQLGPGHTIVFVLCDRGELYTDTVYDPAFLKEHHLTPEQTGDSLQWLS
eukprot:g25579.t1